MLITDEAKNSYSLMIANTLMHFIHHANENGLMETLLDFSKTPGSRNFNFLRDRLAAMFAKNIENQEVLLMYKEIYALVKDSGEPV